MDQYNYRVQSSTGLWNQLRRKTYLQCWIDTGQNPAHGPAQLSSPSSRENTLYMLLYFKVFFQRNREEYQVFNSLLPSFLIFGQLWNSLGFDQFAGQSILVATIPGSGSC